MKGFAPLFRKEMLEQFKLYRLVIVCAIFLFFALSSAVLMAMGGIANELKSGTAIMTLSKPVSRSAFVISKLLAVSITFLISMTAASLVCLGYTVWLIQGTAVLPYVGMNLLTGLFLVFCLAVTLLFSSHTRARWQPAGWPSA